VALVVWVLARQLEPWMRRLYGVYLVGSVAGFAVVLSFVVAAWS
jgi:hypothetical protein